MIKINYQGFDIEVETPQEAAQLLKKISLPEETISGEPINKVQIIRNKSKRVKRQNNKWTWEETDYLKANFDKTPLELSRHLGIGSRHTIQSITSTKFRLLKEKRDKEAREL